MQKLQESGSEPSDTRELHERMAELQSEMFRLEVQRKKLGYMTGLNGAGVGPGAGDRDQLSLATLLSHGSHEEGHNNGGSP